MTGLPFVRGSDTSEAAAASKETSALSDEERVLTFIRARGAAGATDDEIELALGMLHQNASARRRTLVLRGYVHDSGLRRPTRSGRPDRGVALKASDYEACALCVDCHRHWHNHGVLPGRDRSESMRTQWMGALRALLFFPAVTFDEDAHREIAQLAAVHVQRLRRAA